MARGGEGRVWLVSDARVSGTGVVVAGRYRLDGRIAAGAMGEVWRGVDTMLDRPVAVKLLRAEHARHGEILSRFRAEARHAGSLSHPGIVRVYDFGEEGPGHSPYLVMELVLGRSLARVLAFGPMEPARAMDVVAQTAAGLHAAHAAGLVHLDIKPANLLLRPGGQVKITDFGIASAVAPAPAAGSGTLIGTLAYLAPERIDGAPATPASDLYSLGIVAWECLVGAPPFTGIGVEAALAYGDRPLPSAVPAQVAALVAELMAANPAARPAADEAAGRAGRLRDALTSGASGRPGRRPDPPGATLTGRPAGLSDGDSATLAEVSLPDTPPRRRRLLRYRMRPARTLWPRPPERRRER
jgi:serine/threonine-protein kinase